MLPLVSWALAISAASAAHALEVPELRGRVNDLAGVLSQGARAQLEQRLAAYEQETGHQLAFLSVPTLEGDPIEDFSIRVVERWKLGHAKTDTGLLLLVVPNDRQMRIEVGHGLEGEIPDVLAGRIVHDVITPSFRASDFDGGIAQAFELLMQAGRGAAVELPSRPASETRRSTRGGNLVVHGLMILFFFVLPLLSRKRRGLIHLGGLGGLGGGFGGGGGFSSGGGFGGGGFSGGGGSFGGGGASGRW